MSLERKIFKKLNSDIEKWKQLIYWNSLGVDFTVFLDNDATYVDFNDGKDKWESFDGYIGDEYGTYSLLGAIGITCEGV